VVVVVIVIVDCMELALDSRHNGSTATSVKSPVVEKKGCGQAAGYGEHFVIPSVL